MKIRSDFVIVKLAFLSINIILVKVTPCDFYVCKNETTQHSCTGCCKEQNANTAPQDPAKITELSLYVSPNGKAILDQNGQEVARFTAGI